MRVLKYVLTGLATLVVFLVGWGFFEPYLIDQEEHVVEISNLPLAWEGKRVAQISDWQVGMWLDNEPTIRRAVRRIIEIRPALVLITGDFIYHPDQAPEDELRDVARLVRPLGESGIPTYAVLGNHDYAVKEPGGAPREEVARAVRRTLDSLGVRVLENEAVRLEAPEAAGKRPVRMQDGEPLYLVGVGPRWPVRDRPSEALAEVPAGAPRFAMMHHPDTFADFPAHAAPLAVAGHTHGGQIRLPLTPSWSWLTFVKEDRVHADGWIDAGYGARGNRLYVNRGIGFGGAPLRINCMPELTLFTLRRPPS